MLKYKKYIDFAALSVLFYYFVIYTITISSVSVINQDFITTLILLLSFVILFIYCFRYFNEIFKDCFWLIFLFLYMIIYFIFYYFYPSDYMTKDLLIFQLKIIIYAIFNLMIGLYFFNNLNNKFFQFILYVSFFLLIGFILYNLDYNTLKYTLKYQVVGTVLPIIGLYIAFVINKKSLKIFFITIVLLLLFFINARSSFYSFVIVYLFFIFKEIGYKNTLYLIFTTIFILFLYYFFDILRFDERMFGFTNLDKDGSFKERIEQFQNGFDAIKNNWFFGQYGGHIIVVNENSIYETVLGSYMHNIFSFWRQYGVLFFLIFTIFYFSRLFKVFILWKNKNTNCDFVFYLGLYISVNMIFFHSYDYPQIWFSLIIMHLYVIEEQKNV